MVRGRKERCGKKRCGGAGKKKRKSVPLVDYSGPVSGRGGGGAGGCRLACTASPLTQCLFVDGKGRSFAGRASDLHTMSIGDLKSDGL